MTRKQAVNRMSEERADACARAEADSIFNENEALKPVPAATVPVRFKTKPIFLHDVYDEKFNPDGTFDKDKARFVCGETKKNATLLDSEKSTPTPSPQSILLNVAIAKSEKRKVRTWDIKSAFLKAPVKRELYVRVSSSIVKALLSMDPEAYKPHILPDGTMCSPTTPTPHSKLC